MIWDETMIKYAARRMCNKHQPRNCRGCKLKEKGGCRLGLLIDEVKEWAKQNIPQEVLEGRRVK